MSRPSFLFYYADKSQLYRRRSRDQGLILTIA